MVDPLTEKNDKTKGTQEEKQQKFKLLYLCKEDIEEGDHRLRGEIFLNDPKIANLYESIKRNGLMKPIHVYPSPLSNGKYRIVDGHIRKYICFDHLRGIFPGGPGMLAICKERTEQEAYEDALILNNGLPLNKIDKSYFIKTLMERFKDEYPNFDEFCKKHGRYDITNDENCSYGTGIIRSFINTWKKMDLLGVGVPLSKFDDVSHLPYENIKPISTAPKDDKSAIISAVVSYNLSVRETRKLIKAIRGQSFSSSDIYREAKKIKTHAPELMTENQLEVIAQFISKDERLKIFKKFLKQLEENPIYEVTPERQTARFLQVSDQIVYSWVRKEKVPSPAKLAQMLKYLISKNPSSIATLLKAVEDQIFEIHLHLTNLVT